MGTWCGLHSQTAQTQALPCIEALFAAAAACDDEAPEARAGRGFLTLLCWVVGDAADFSLFPIDVRRNATRGLRPRATTGEGMRKSTHAQAL